jgi:hypothetical protein
MIVGIVGMIQADSVLRNLPLLSMSPFLSCCAKISGPIKNGEKTANTSNKALI